MPRAMAPLSLFMLRIISTERDKERDRDVKASFVCLHACTVGWCRFVGFCMEVFPGSVVIGGQLVE